MSSENLENKDNISNSEETNAALTQTDSSVDQKAVDSTAETVAKEDLDELENVTLDYLNDYESLLKYTLKLLEDNKHLMNENIKLKLEAQEMQLLNLKLLKENELLKGERDHLMRDTMTMLEYNDTLQEAKDLLEQDLLDIKSKFETILGGLRELETMDKDLAKPEGNGDQATTN